MGIPGRGPDGQLQIADSPHSEKELRATIRIDAAGLPDAGVGGQQVSICLDERLQPGAADLLFAFYQELDAGRMPAGHILHGIDSGQTRDDVALIVRYAPGVHLSVSNAWFERRSFPEVKRLRRLNVVVVVEDDGAVGGAGGLGVDDRMSADQRDYSALESARDQHLFHKLGRLLNTQVLGRHAWLGAQGAQFIEVAFQVPLDVVIQLVCGLLIYQL